MILNRGTGAVLLAWCALGPGAGIHSADGEFELICPASHCGPGGCCIRQTLTKQGNTGQVACGIASPPLTTVNGFARCFDLGLEGIPGGFVIDSVKFGVEQLVLHDSPAVQVDVNLYLDADGFCPPSIFTSNLIDSQPVLLHPADADRHVVVTFPDGPPLPPLGALVVEIRSPDDGTQPPGLHAFRPMSCAQVDSCGDSYLRAEGCGPALSDWVPVSAPPLGFPNSQTIIEVSGHQFSGSPVTCGDGMLGGCEVCDDANTVCGDGCDSHCHPEGVCGDGVLDCLEQCDGSDDGACPGLCIAGCVCQGPCDPPDLDPPNDCCTGAQIIGVGDTSFDTTGANTDGPPNPPGLCNNAGSIQTYHDLWYDFFAPCNTVVTVSTCGLATFDTNLVMYSTCDCALVGPDTLLACSDDAPGCSGFTSEFSAEVVGGDCYKIRVGGRGPADQGLGTVSIGHPPCFGCVSDDDCEDGDPCTQNICLIGGVCEIQPKTCQSTCPLCQGPCDPESGCLCVSTRPSGMWNWTDDIWNLSGPNPYPDTLMGVPNVGAVIENFADIFLDVTVAIPRLCVLDDSILRVTQTTPLLPTGDITVFGPEGVFIRGDFRVGQRHLVDVSAGPVVIGPRGKYRADPDLTDPVSAALSAASLTLLEAPAGQAGGTMILTDSMSVAVLGNVALDDKGSCTPPDLNVQDAAAMAVAGDFSIIHAAIVTYGSSEPMSLEGDFDNGSVEPALFDWVEGGLRMIGSGASQLSRPVATALEAAGEDRGAYLGPAQEQLADNFAFGDLTVAAGANVAVVDVHDNQLDGQTECEAVYVADLLTIEPGAVLDLTSGCPVYYGQLNNQGTIVDPGPSSLIEILTVCEQADFNNSGGVNAADLAVLLGNWGNPGCSGSQPCEPDLNLDGLVNAADLALLLGNWGACGA